MFTGASASDGVSRLGLDRETCLETRFLESRSRRSVMALGHYMREKSTESKGDSPAESTQTAETIESGSAGKTWKGANLATE